MSGLNSPLDDALLDALLEFAPYDWPVGTIARMTGIKVEEQQLMLLSARGLIERGRRELMMASTGEVAQEVLGVDAEFSREHEWIALTEKGAAYVQERRARERLPALALSRDISAAAKGRLDAAAMIIAIIALMLALISLVIGVAVAGKLFL